MSKTKGKPGLKMECKMCLVGKCIKAVGKLYKIIQFVSKMWSPYVNMNKLLFLELENWNLLMRNNTSKNMGCVNEMKNNYISRLFVILC